MANHRSKVFRDAIHGLISIDRDRKLLLALIDTPEFQRLRRIRQLGISSLTYPNAEHTRFAHSLGVLYVATQILETLELRHGEDEIEGERLSRNRRSVKVAALLHDLGHGPFSHLIERLFDSNKQHERRSKIMITDEKSGIYRVLRAQGMSPTEIEETRDLLDFHEAAYLHDIISSSLDADRMDYLLRDSHFTGVAYGNIDLEWLLNSFCLGLDPAPRGAEDDLSPRPLRLCLDSKRGQFAAEQLIVARSHMSMQVYFHRTTRMWEAHLLMLLSQATELADKDRLPGGTLPHVVRFLQKRGDVSHEDFLRLDEPSLLACIGIWADEGGAYTELADLSTRFLNRDSLLLCRELPKDDFPQHAIAKLRADLDKRVGPERRAWVLDDHEFRAYKAPEAKLKTDNPEKYWSRVSKDAILLSSGELTELAAPIQAKSSLLQSMGTASMPINRIFFHPEHQGAIEDLTSS